MSKQVDKSLFILSSFSVPGFYQEVLAGVSNYRESGNRLIKKAMTAQASRRLEIVGGGGRLLLNFPIILHGKLCTRATL